MQIRELCAHLGRGYSAIQQQAMKTGVSKIGRPGSGWTADEDELLSDLYGTMSQGDISGILGRTESAVVHRAMKLGVNKRWHGTRPRLKSDTVRTMRRDAARHDYFGQIDSPVKAYLLGWLASDGNVKTDNNAIRLRIAADDEDVLHLARAEFAPLHKITYYQGGKRVMASLIVASGQMKQDLCRLGVTPNKTHTLQYPPVPSHLDGSFILGYFDGDGSLFRDGGRAWRWNLTSSSRPMLVSVQDRIERATGQRPRGPHVKANRTRPCYRLDLNGRYIPPVDAWLHAEVPGLSRKRLPVSW